MKIKIEFEDGDEKQTFVDQYDYAKHKKQDPDQALLLAFAMSFAFLDDIPEIELLNMENIEAWGREDFS